MTTFLTPWTEHLDIDGNTFTPHPENGIILFPDNEVYVQLEEVEQLEQATIIHSGWEPNAGTMFLYGALDLLRQHDIPTTVVFTYFPYSRQDDSFHPGTVNYARSILDKLDAYYNVDTILGVDTHFSHRDWTDQYPYSTLNTFPLIQQAVDMEDYVVVGPDAGAVERFSISGNADRATADSDASFNISGFEKERNSTYDVNLSGEVDVAGRNVLVFDDILATGGTMVSAYERLKEQGAETVAAATVHGVMESGVNRVQETFDRFYLTNTIPNEEENVFIEPVIEEALSDIS